MNKLLVFVGLLLFMSGCSSTPTETTHQISNTQVYRNNFNNVWRAAQIALQNYPVKINNSEKGVIETEFIKEGDVWAHPTRSSSTSKRYQLKLRAVKGVIQSKPAIKIIILKKVKHFKNFVEGSTESLSVDHLEESTILYRIKRELIIDLALSKLQQGS